MPTIAERAAEIAALDMDLETEHEFSMQRLIRDQAEEIQRLETAATVHWSLTDENGEVQHYKGDALAAGKQITSMGLKMERLEAEVKAAMEKGIREAAAYTQSDEVFDAAPTLSELEAGILSLLEKPHD